MAVHRCQHRPAATSTNRLYGSPEMSIEQKWTLEFTEKKTLLIISFKSSIINSFDVLPCDTISELCENITLFSLLKGKSQVFTKFDILERLSILLNQLRHFFEISL